MTIEVPNSDGAGYRQLSNTARELLATNFAGKTAPPDPRRGMFWMDIPRKELKYCASISGRGVANWITILKTRGTTTTLEIPVRGGSAPARATSKEIEDGTEQGIRSFSPKDIKNAVLEHSPVLSEGRSGIYIQEDDPGATEAGRFWYKPSNGSLSIYNGNNWTEIGTFAGSDPAFSLAGPLDQVPTGNLSLLNTGTDTVKRVWSAAALTAGIRQIAPQNPRVVDQTTLAAGIGRESVGISPYTFREAIKLLGESTTSGSSLSISDFISRTTTPKLVTGRALRQMMTHSSLGLSVSQAQSSGSTTLGLVSGYLLSQVTSQSSSTSSYKDKIQSGSTRMECYSTSIRFVVSGRTIATLTSSGLSVLGKTPGASVSRSGVLAGVFRKSTWQGGSVRYLATFNNWSYSHTSNIRSAYRSTSGTYYYQFTSPVNTSGARAVIDASSAGPLSSWQRSGSSYSDQSGRLSLSSLFSSRTIRGFWARPGELSNVPGFCIFK